MENALGRTTKTTFNRAGAAVAVLAAGALVLSACSSHNSEETYAGTAAVTCGGKPTLTASGSTAQANAMTLFINAFQKACQG